MGNKNKSSSSDDDLEDRKQEQPLQAVLLADDWNTTTWAFAPLDDDQRPPILCPFLDRPLLEYTIRYLASQGVLHVILVCVTRAVEEYATASLEQRWRHAYNLECTIVRDTSVANAGDALRELDKRSLVGEQPFLLLHGPTTLTNVDLAPILRAHAERRAKDPTVLMTLLVQETTTNTDTLEDLILGVDPHQSNRLLVYQTQAPEEPSTMVPCSFFTSHCTELQVYTSVLDAGIDICSPDVLLKFSDEFDYRHIRSQFVVNAVAEEEEGLQNKLYAHFLVKPTDYIGRCSDIRTLHQTCRDIMRRHAFPLVIPSLPLRRRNYVYIDLDTVRLGRSSTITGPAWIGANVSVGEQCVLQGAVVVSNHCHIGDQCRLENAHLWEGVQIESHVSISDAILGAGVVVRSGATISRGCVIGAGCIIGTGITIPGYTRLTCSVESMENDGFDDGDDWSTSSSEANDDDATPEASDPAEITIESHPELVGKDGVGRLWQPNPEDIDEDYFLSTDLILESQCIGFEPNIITDRIRSLHAEEDTAIDDNKTVLDLDNKAVLFGTPTIIGRQEGVDVVKELKGICLEYEDTSPIENLAIELNSYKFSQNATYSDCTLAATLAIIDKMGISDTTTDGKLVADFKNLLGTWKPLLQKMSIGLDEEKAVVVALQQSALESPVLSTGMSFRFLLQTLHDEEIVSEESILSWASDPNAALCLVEMKPVQEFLEWLQEESDSDEDGSSDEESE